MIRFDWIKNESDMDKYYNCYNDFGAYPFWVPDLQSTEWKRNHQESYNLTTKRMEQLLYQYAHKHKNQRIISNSYILPSPPQRLAKCR